MWHLGHTATTTTNARGNHQGGNLVLLELDLRIAQKPGDVVIMHARVLVHMVFVIYGDGNRIWNVHYSNKRILQPTLQDLQLQASVSSYTYFELSILHIHHPDSWSYQIFRGCCMLGQYLYSLLPLWAATVQSFLSWEMSDAAIANSNILQTGRRDQPGVRYRIVERFWNHILLPDTGELCWLISCSLSYNHDDQPYIHFRDTKIAGSFVWLSAISGDTATLYLFSYCSLLPAVKAWLTHSIYVIR